LNLSQNAFEIAKHIVVPETKHSVTFLAQTTISYRIRGRPVVLSTIDFNNQKSFTAHEIADIAAYRLLSHKFMSIDLSVANAIPENNFRVV
jgi:hypothetical protein